MLLICRAGRLKAVAAGKVVQAGPGRYMGAARAKIVQTGVVQVPAQVGVVQLVLLQPVIKSNSV